MRYVWVKVGKRWCKYDTKPLNLTKDYKKVVFCALQEK